MFMNVLIATVIGGGLHGLPLPAVTVPAPVNVRATQSLDECRTYAGGGFAGFGCVAAMNGHFYVIIWDANGTADGFNVYERGQRPGAGWQLLAPPSPLRPVAAGKDVAMLDPAKVGTGACFSVTTLSGGKESARSAPVCVGASSQTSFVWPPKDLRTTSSLDECRSYAGGGLAGFGCAAAMDGHFYVLIWDSIGGNADGFNIYEGAGTGLGRALLGWHLLKPPSPLLALSNGTLVRAAMLDPAKVGTNACFAVSTLSGGHESERSSPLCVGAANQTQPVTLGYVIEEIAPARMRSFWWITGGTTG